ncbi:hypothetical protein BJ875DRAFT_84185 [Amylocarpus encephaloides]|uniref:Uncharacterized protein n=1 Tax=Amylocarpus encephaloides TaxID=45428 RepID=A0A9P7YV17_9HELO|nr:hypothetical protein BJ875DRAFT_84185 [Amylocarpus encephaloides]
MFSMLPSTPAHFNHNLNHAYQFSPVVSSPLSSSPLRSSPTPSPLSPRDGNLPSQNPIEYNFGGDKMMTSPTPSFSRTKSSHPSLPTSRMRPQSNTINLPSPPPSRGKERETAFSKRVAKPNPLFHSRRDCEDGRETRRKLFLKNVRDGAEEKRWKSRGGDDEIMRVLWIGEERERAKNLELSLRAVGELVPDEEGVNFDEIMADEVARNEAAELEAMMEDVLPYGEQDMDALPRHTQNALHGQRNEPSESLYGSDDDEYDNIFLDVAMDESRWSTAQQPQEPGYLQYDQEMMDMS